MAEDSIRIVDFWEAFLSATCIRKRLHLPVWFAGPKVLFCDPIAPPLDIWALAYLLYNISGDRRLFASLDGNRDEGLVEMTRTFCRLPNRLVEPAGEMSSLPHGRWTGYEGDKRTSGADLRTRLKVLTHGTHGGLESEEVEMLEWILHGMLKYEPGKEFWPGMLCSGCRAFVEQEDLRCKSLGLPRGAQGSGLS